MSEVEATTHDAPVVGDVVEESKGHELVAPRRGEVLRPLDLRQTKAAMEAYQRGLREILDSTDWQTAGREKFVKRSGWAKIAAWFDLSVEILRDEIERAQDGTIQRATVWARASAASGRFMDGDGHCSITEERFTEAKGRKKLEHDLRSTATTRAVSRAISNLVGMGAPDGDSDTGAGIHGPEVDAEIAKTAKQACTRIAGGEAQAGVRLWRGLLGELGGYMPQAAAIALIAAAAAIPQPTTGDREPTDG